MAGGDNARVIVCFQCMQQGQLTPANRVYEGMEDDHYECERGHKFGVDWRRGGPQSPGWPPSEVEQAFAAERAQKIRNGEP